MTATYPTFGSVKEIFGRVYDQLREDQGENAPNSNTWFASTIAALSEEAGKDLDRAEADVILGDGETIAWVYESNNGTLAEIRQGAGDNEILTLFSRFMGYDV